MMVVMMMMMIITITIIIGGFVVCHTVLTIQAVSIVRDVNLKSPQLPFTVVISCL
jgi:hypothetical protein